MSAVVVRGSTARPAKAAAERGSGRASCARSTMGAMVPSKSMATSKCSVPAIRRSASRSSGVNASGLLVRWPSGVIADHLFVQGAQEVRGPVVDVVVQDLAGAWHRMRRDASRGRQLDRVHDGVLEARDIVRVDQERLLELVRGAGEFAEDQGAVVIVPAVTYSLATRFIPSRRAVTSMTSAAR